MELTSGPFDAADGLKLFAHWYPPRAGGEPRAGAVVLHGYDDHGGRYNELCEFLAGLGFAVMAVDYRGHGKATGARGHCDRFDEFLGDVERACDHALKALGPRPLVLYGHSHGSLIALRELCDPQRTLPGVQAAILSSPYLGLALKVPALKLHVGRLASNLIPGLALKNEIDAALLTHDKKAIETRLADKLCHGVATARWFTEATAAQEYVIANVHKVGVPTLWQIAADDRIADAKVSQQAFDKAGGHKTLKLYDGFYHETWNESERARVFQDIEAWISPRYPPLSASSSTASG